MSWHPPHPPTGSYQSIVAYWKAILEIPLNEPGAAMLRDMASQRLTELEIIYVGATFDEPDPPASCESRPPVRRQH